MIPSYVLALTNSVEKMNSVGWEDVIQNRKEIRE